MDADPRLEPVYTIDDWYDGPRAGFASYRGVPHHYRSLYLDSETWDADEDRFELVAVGAEVLASALEASAIFYRWNELRRQGGVDWTADAPESEFGALPEDRDRYAMLRAALAPYEVAGHPQGFIARGEFELGCKRVRWLDDSERPPSNDR
jgi:hypothetical protein